MDVSSFVVGFDVFPADTADDACITEEGEEGGRIMTEKTKINRAILDGFLFLGHTEPEW